MKLSSAQVRVLQIIARTGFPQGVGPEGVRTTHPGKTVVVLENKGLITYIKGRVQPTDPQYALTPAGKAFVVHLNTTRVPCSVCTDGSCMLCDDHGMVPLTP